VQHRAPFYAPSPATAPFSAVSNADNLFATRDEIRRSRMIEDAVSVRNSGHHDNDDDDDDDDDTEKQREEARRKKQ